MPRSVIANSAPTLLSGLSLRFSIASFLVKGELKILVSKYIDQILTFCFFTLVPLMIVIVLSLGGGGPANDGLFRSLDRLGFRHRLIHRIEKSQLKRPFFRACHENFGLLGRDFERHGTHDDRVVLIRLRGLVYGQHLDAVSESFR